MVDTGINGRYGDGKIDTNSISDDRGRAVSVELLATIFLTTVVLSGLFWALIRSQNSRYRPDRHKVEDLLKKVIEGEALPQTWDLYVGCPILHDPELDEIRRRCAALSEGDGENPPYPSGIGRYIFNRDGRQQVELILKDLQQLIADEPYNQDF